jgi:AAA15 family ATPase/GTPase
MPLLQLKFNYKLNNDNNSSYKGTLLLSQSDNAPGNSINTINMSINKPTSLKKIPPCKVVKDILTRQDFSMLLQALTDIEGTDAKDEFLGLMQQYDNNIRNIYIGSSINTNTSYIYISKKNGVKTPLFAMGDGFARIVTMALLAFSAKDGMLLIDEFDSGLHFSVLKSSLSWLLKFCQKLNVQLFMSTHSLEAIDALSACTNNIENFDLALYHMHKSEIVTSITRYNQKKLNILRQEYGSEVR